MLPQPLPLKLFTCVSAALGKRGVVEAAIEDGRLSLPRMADFAAFVEGAHAQLALPLGGFSELLRTGQNALQIESVTGDPVGAGLIRYFSRPDAQPVYETASGILRILTADNLQERNFPAANGFGKRLNRIAVGLRLVGIAFETEAASGHANVPSSRYQNYRIFRLSIMAMMMQNLAAGIFKNMDQPNTSLTC